MNLKSKKLLILILLVAAFLRLWKLGTIPPHLTPDEAALGYNAYSILETGRDEYGDFLPIVFKSFGDFKPGLYIYAAAPFIGALGLSEFAVRLPSAIAGVTAVWLIYKIVLLLFAKQSYRSPNSVNRTLAIIASLLLAISPWHIHYSRGAWEVSLSLTLTLAGIYFFLKAFEKPKLLYLSSLFFASTFLAYQGAKLSTSIVLFILLLVYWNKVKKWIDGEKPVLIKSVLLGVIVALPIIFSLFQGKTGRLNVFSVFSYPRPEGYLQTFLDQGKEEVGDFSYYLFHSETLNFTRGIIGRWGNHYSDRFLFFDGDWQNQRHSAPYHGMFVLGDLALLLFGFIALARSRGRGKWFVFLWILLAPLPSALSRDQVHAVRSFNMVVPMILLFSFGSHKLLGLFKEKEVIKKLALLGFVLLYLATYVYFLDSYFVHLPKNDSKYWKYGYKQIVETVTPIQDDYEEIKVQQSYSQPYIYFLFYQKYDPVDYQNKARLIESEIGDVGQVERLDNICFCPIDWSVVRGDSGALIVGDPVKIPERDFKGSEDFDLIKEIKYLDGETAFYVLEIK